MKAALTLLAISAVFGTAFRSGPADLVVELQTDFDHEQHKGMFPTCVTCHAGVTEPGAPLWPSVASCADCHDGVIQQRVEWTAPQERPHTNLRFEHIDHVANVTAIGDSAIACVDCHARPDADWMSVELAVVEQCLSCHNIAQEHLAASDSACAACHVPLTQATRLTYEDVRAFKAPPSHNEHGFELRGGHGLLAYRPAGQPTMDSVAASCATCHARDFCMQCHVDAIEQPAIQALATDDRSLVFEASLPVPVTHETIGFLKAHGSVARTDPAECRSCHAQESCVGCHVSTPYVAEQMFGQAPGRGTGAPVRRRRPQSHGSVFAGLHGADAAAGPQTCAGCHAREDCLACHRPDAATASPAYHPTGFLVRHPSAAYARETSCSDCHNARSFCASCHQQSGLTGERALISSGYHDGQRFFIAGHGQAARQNLESCVSCHTERDCAVCHSAVGGRRVNPHGPGFDAVRLRRRNPEMCTACHGTAIPDPR